MGEAPLVMHGNHCPLCGARLLLTLDWGWSLVCLCGFNEHDIFIIEGPKASGTSFAVRTTPIARAA